MSTVAVLPRNHVYAFAALHHHGQKRKYTGEPYFTHCVAVANMADGKCRFGYEIALCHDLFEDTNCSHKELQDALIRFGYFRNEAEYIVDCVVQLTDIYTSEDFPEVNRAKRKELESNRLHKIGYEAQTVKYCDLIHNTESIVKYDKGFAVKYLAEKATILKGMNKGNPAMYAKCKRVLKKAQKTILN